MMIIADDLIINYTYKVGTNFTFIWDRDNIAHVTNDTTTRPFHHKDQRYNQITSFI